MVCILSTGVDYADWKDEIISLYFSAERDTIQVATGHSDSVSLVIENYTDFDELLDVEISDDLGWITDQANRKIAIGPEYRQVPQLYYSVPEDAPVGVHN